MCLTDCKRIFIFLNINKNFLKIKRKNIIMANTKIAWTDKTWNVTHGCNKYSAGCINCYAEIMAKRFPKVFGDFNEIHLHPDRLNEPLKWKKPCMVFVVSMGDLFHRDVPLSFIQKAFKVMNECHWHTFQVLTKRAERLIELSSQLTWSDNIWTGVTIEDEKYLYRMEMLKKSGARLKWLSIEPMLRPLPNMDLSEISWIVIGGESSQRARPMKKEWVIDVLNQCRKNNIPFFYKQGSGFRKSDRGNLLNGNI